MARMKRTDRMITVQIPAGLHNRLKALAEDQSKTLTLYLYQVLEGHLIQERERKLSASR